MLNEHMFTVMIKEFTIDIKGFVLDAIASLGPIRLVGQSVSQSVITKKLNIFSLMRERGSINGRIFIHFGGQDLPLRQRGRVNGWRRRVECTLCRKGLK